MTDMWQGRPLPERRRVSGPLTDQIHYRLYDRRTMAVVSFNSTNSFESIVADIANTQREHPNAQIIAVQYDGPAY
jgi:TolB-like protein